MNLIKKIAEEQNEKTVEVMLKFPWHNPLAYATWLAQTYFMVNHSTRLVAFAGALVGLDKESLHARFVDHAKEERGHPQLCLRDLKTLNYTIEDFTEMASSASMYQIQYYWIQHVNPTSFFGYVLSLEKLGASIGSKLYEMTSSAHTTRACSFLKVHSDADVEHVEKAMEQIKILNDHDQKHVLRNLELSCELYRSMLLQIENAVGSKKSAA